MAVVQPPGQDHVQLLVLERIDPALNMARYYVLSVEPTLFGDTALIREWGRLGVGPRRRIDLHADRETACLSLDAWFERKLKRGYVMRQERVRPAPVDGPAPPDRLVRADHRAAVCRCSSEIDRRGPR